MLRPTAPTARPLSAPWGKRTAGDRLTSGYALPPSDYPRRHSHPDCRSPLTLIVARQRRTVQDIEDGEFKLIETTPAKGKDAA